MNKMSYSNRRLIDPHGPLMTALAMSDRIAELSKNVEESDAQFRDMLAGLHEMDEHFRECYEREEPIPNAAGLFYETFLKAEA